MAVDLRDPQTTQKWTIIADAVEGTNDSPDVIAEKFDVDEEDVDETLAELGVETCPGCGWWWADMELNEADGFCPDCLED